MEMLCLKRLTYGTVLRYVGASVTAVTAQEVHAQLPQPLQLPVGLRL